MLGINLLGPISPMLTPHGSVTRGAVKLRVRMTLGRAGVCQETGDKEEPDHGNMGLGVKMAAMAMKPICLCHLGLPQPPAL